MFNVKFTALKKLYFIYLIKLRVYATQVQSRSQTRVSVPYETIRGWLLLLRNDIIPQLIWHIQSMCLCFICFIALTIFVFSKYWQKRMNNVMVRF